MMVFDEVDDARCQCIIIINIAAHLFSLERQDDNIVLSFLYTKGYVANKSIYSLMYYESINLKDI